MGILGFDCYNIQFISLALRGMCCAKYEVSKKIYFVLRTLQFPHIKINLKSRP